MFNIKLDGITLVLKMNMFSNKKDGMYAD